MKRTLIAVAVSLGMTAALFAAGPTPAELQKEARISMEQARVTALKRVPHGKIESGELEREHGKLIYSFDVRNSRGITEVNVDAKNGKVISAKRESKSAEAAEKKAESKKQ